MANSACNYNPTASEDSAEPLDGRKDENGSEKPKDYIAAIHGLWDVTSRVCLFPTLLQV